MEWVIWMAPGIRLVTGGEDGLQMSVDTAMGHMHCFYGCLCLREGKKEPVRMIENPIFEQEQIPAVFGCKIDGEVSQKLKA